MKKSAPEIEEGITIVTWENNDGQTEARVFDTPENSVEVTEFLTVLMSDSEDDYDLEDEDINNGVVVDTVTVYSAEELGAPTVEKTVSFK